MHWHKVTIAANASEAEHIEALFWDHGALSVTLTDPADAPIYEPEPGTTPLWSALEICGLFEQECDVTSIVAEFETLGHVVNQVETLAERVWEREWLSQFQPMSFGQRLWIVPTEFEVPETAEVAVRLDPGLAFGTGTHATTALILAWMDGHDFNKRSVLDYGCGSGILAIAALLLGAEDCLAVDLDPQAICATEDNALLNGVSDRLNAISPAQFESKAYDVVLANILAEPIIGMAQQLTECLAPEGILVLSGIMTSQQEMVEAHFRDDLQFIDQFEREGWLCLVARRC